MIAYHTLFPPIIGMADSGDFGRFFPQTGLDHVSTEYQDRYFFYFNSKYRIVERVGLFGWYKSSTQGLILPARWLAMLTGAREFFDIRFLAALYAVIFLIGFWLILVAARPLNPALRVILAGLVILIFTDAGYVAFFNSLYSGATGFTFLAVGIGLSLLLLARRSANALLLAGVFVTFAVIITAKPQWVPLAPVLAAFLIYLSRFVRMRGRDWLAGGLALVLCATAALYYARVPQQLREELVYIGIFVDLLPNSPSPQDDLMALGLDPAFADFAGTTPYQLDSPFYDTEIRSLIASRVNSHSLAMFYLARPDRLYGLCARCVKHLFITRVKRLGYYEASTGKPPQTQAFGLWSVIRENVFPRSLVFLALYFATGIAALYWSRKASLPVLRSLNALYVLFVAIACVTFFASILGGGGEADLAKHLFMFNISFDASLILSVLGALHWAGRCFSGAAQPSVA